MSFQNFLVNLTFCAEPWSIEEESLGLGNTVVDPACPRLKSTHDNYDGNNNDNNSVVLTIIISNIRKRISVKKKKKKLSLQSAIYTSSRTFYFTQIRYLILVRLKILKVFFFYFYFTLKLFAMIFLVLVILFIYFFFFRSTRNFRPYYSLKYDSSSLLSRTNEASYSYWLPAKYPTCPHSRFLHLIPRFPLNNTTTPLFLRPTTFPAQSPSPCRLFHHIFPSFFE